MAMLEWLKMPISALPIRLVLRISLTISRTRPLMFRKTMIATKLPEEAFYDRRWLATSAGVGYFGRNNPTRDGPFLSETVVC
jgi:hypothetical protein